MIEIVVQSGVPQMKEGTQLGSYRVLRKIGQGGMGSIWLAEHVRLGRHAAIKVLHPELLSRPEIVTRFFNEARAATAISDPGIVQIFDFGQHSDGSAYLAMELLEGEPLNRRLARLGALELAEALRIMRQVASTVGAAHACGIIHRDLKPENVFIVRDPEVAGGERAKILDFGIAKLGGDLAGVRTGTAAVMGTPRYMSPEQCRGAGGVDQRSDVYSLGCVLFTLLVGHPPFGGEGSGDLIAMHLRELPPVPSSLRPGLPPEVDQLVLRCLAKDPAQRFDDGGALAAAIASVLAASPTSAPLGPSATYAAGAKTTLSAATGTSIAVERAQPRRATVFAVLGAGAVVGVIAALAVLRVGPGASSEAAPVSTPAPEVLMKPSPSPAPGPSGPSAEIAARTEEVVTQPEPEPGPSLGTKPEPKPPLQRKPQLQRKPSLQRKPPPQPKPAPQPKPIVLDKEGLPIHR
jgi:serine/threonine-protein kinase